MNLDRFVGEAITLMRRSPDVAYGDIRVLVSAKREGLAVKNGIVESTNRSEMSGFGIRILSPKGAWGFSSGTGLDRSDAALSDGLCAAFRKAVALAAAGSRGRSTPLVLAPREMAPGNTVFSYHSPWEEDAFSVPLEEKLALLLTWDAAMAESAKKLIVRKSAMSFWANDQMFASFERGVGIARIRQSLRGGNVLVSATASDGTEVHTMTPWGFDGKHFVGG